MGLGPFDVPGDRGQTEATNKRKNIVVVMTLTPSEARQLADDGREPDVDKPVLDRLKVELAAGVYSGCQKAAVANLVRAWESQKDGDRDWVLHMQSKPYVPDVGYSVYDRITDFPFWVRALGYAAAFRNERGVRLLKQGYARQKQAA